MTEFYLDLKRNTKISDLNISENQSHSTVHDLLRVAAARKESETAAAAAAAAAREERIYDPQRAR